MEKLKIFIQNTISLLFFLVLNVACLTCYAQPQLIFPVECTEGKDCWIVNYVDVDPTSNAVKDFHCGPRSYDNHKGTDIAIRDWVAMEDGVNVLAAAEGTVLRLRDGVKDKILSREQLDSLLKSNMACGNGVFIEHGDGWQTIYCHLKKNSIVVKKNETVKAGQKIGQVGHSGYVEFPHLHMGVMFNDTTIDPYTGLSNQEACGHSGQSIWSTDQLSDYRHVSIYATGFEDSIPIYDQIKKDATSQVQLSRNIPALTFWAIIFGVIENDQIHMEIRDPRGQIFAERNITQKKTRTRQYYYVGKKNTRSDIKEGKYKGVITLSRKLPNGKVLKWEKINEFNLY